jgi:hypothetical protein
MSGCSRHPSKEATGACINCGKLTCAICDIELGGKRYCQPCADKLFAKQVAASQEIKPVVIEPSKPVLPDSTKPVSMGLEEKDKTVIVASTIATVAVTDKKPKEQPAKVGWVWWIPPAILGWIGGLLSWFANKDQEPETARYMLFGGIGMSVLQGIFAVILVFALCVPAVIKQGPNTTTSTNDKTRSGTLTDNQQTANSTTNKTKSGITTDNQQTNTSTTNKTKSGTATTNTPPVDYKLTPLNSQAVQPSDTDQTISYQDKLLVTIPGGQLKEAQKLTISSVGNPPPCSSGETQLAVYDISFDKQHEFDSNLTFKFKYDPALIGGDRPPEMSLGVACFDNITQHWVPVASKVDSTTSTITALTQHNGLWMLVNYTKYQNVLITEHCAIFYYPADFWTPKVAKYLELKAQHDVIKAIEGMGLKGAGTYVWPIERYKEWGSLDSDPEVIERRSQIEYAGKLPAEHSHYYTDNPDVPKYIVDIGYFADHAWNVYRDNFQAEPWLDAIELATYKKLSQDSVLSGGIIQSPYYATTVLAFPIYIDGKYVSPQYSPITKNIGVGFTQATTGDLAETISHELFHAMQHKNYSMFTRAFLAPFTLGYSRPEWWMDSTAEYAAFKLATHNTLPTNRVITGSYLIQDFYSWAPFGSEKSSDTQYEVFGDGLHVYKDAYFYDYLDKVYGMEFVPLYKHVSGFTSPGEGLDDYFKSDPLRPKALPNPSTNEYYRKFAAYLVMDEKSPMDAMIPTQVPLSKQSGVYALGHSIGLTCQMQGLRPEVGSSDRTLLVSIAAPSMVDYCRVDLYVLKGGKRLDTYDFDPTITWTANDKTGGGTLGNPLKLGEIKISTGDDLYIFSTSDSMQTPTVFLEDKLDPTLSIESNLPSGSDGMVCTDYKFVAKHNQMPDGTTYTWTVDGNKADSTADTLTRRFSNSGDHVIKVTASWDRLGKSDSKEATAIAAIDKPKLTIIGPKEIGPGEKMYRGESYTFEAVPEFVPDTATFNWTTGATGKVFIATPKVAATNLHLTAMASWDVDGCTGKVESNDLQFEIAELSVDIQANPGVGTEGKETVFTATSPHIPEKFVYSWEVTDEDGVTGISTLKLSSPVPHTYKKAGSYAVKVTVMDREGKTQASKQIRYTVQAAQLPAKVTIIPPPDITAGKGVEGVRYVFVASTENVPKGAMYTWYLNGQVATGGIDDPEAVAEKDFFKAGQYIMVVTVTWKDPVLGDQRVTNTISYQIKSGTVTPPVTPTLSITCSGAASGLIVNNEYTFTANMANATPTGAYSWNVGGGNSTTALNASSAKCKFTSAGTYTITLKATGKAATGNQELSAQLPVTVYGNTEISKEEVSFIVYRWVTQKMPSGETTKTRQYCQNFHMQILRDNMVIDGGDSAARNGAFEIVLPTGHYQYKVGGKYQNPSGECAGTGYFDVIKGGRNYVEHQDNPYP